MRSRELQKSAYGYIVISQFFIWLIPPLVHSVVVPTWPCIVEVIHGVIEPLSRDFTKPCMGIKSRTLPSDYVFRSDLRKWNYSVCFLEDCLVKFVKTSHTQYT